MLFFNDGLSATGAPEGPGVYLASLDGGDAKRLVAADSGAVYARSGHLLFSRNSAAGFAVSNNGTLAYRRVFLRLRPSASHRRFDQCLQVGSQQKGGDGDRVRAKTTVALGSRLSRPARLPKTSGLARLNYETVGSVVQFEPVQGSRGHATP